MFLNTEVVATQETYQQEKPNIFSLNTEAVATQETLQQQQQTYF